MKRSLALAGVSLGVVYIVAMGWGMVNLGYDTWGAFIVIPLIVVVTVPVLHRVFAGEQADLYSIALLGLAAKFAGSFFRYWVAFDAYGGSSDAARYHDFGKAVADDL